MKAFDTDVLTEILAGQAGVCGVKRRGRLLWTVPNQLH
jgi:hypothetical protein